MSFVFLVFKVTHFQDFYDASHFHNEDSGSYFKVFRCCFEVVTLTCCRLYSAETFSQSGAPHLSRNNDRGASIPHLPSQMYICDELRLKIQPVIIPGESKTAFVRCCWHFTDMHTGTRAVKHEVKEMARQISHT